MRVAVAGAFLLAFAGCVTKPPAYYGANNTPPTGDDYSLAFVELGEFGSYKDRTQIGNAVQLIAKKQRPLLVTYIHGWHNGVTSGDVGKFKKFLNRLAHSPMVKSSNLDVVGVYLAWPGDSFRVPVLSTFTFWDRKRAAERIASNSDCLDSILELSRAARQRPKSYTILLGHSFGGLILERAVAHTVQTLQGQQAVKAPWDLALVLNPASDAVLSRQMVVGLQQLYAQGDSSSASMSSSGQGSTENKPMIVELASENDQATQLTFPIGTSIGAFIGAHWGWNKVDVPARDVADRNSISERAFYLSTPGNNPFLINYAVQHRDDSSADGENDAFDANLHRNRDDRVFYTSAPRKAEAPNLPAEGGGRAPKSATTEWHRWQIVPASEVGKKYKGDPRVPYWVIRVPSHIIDNHGGIWSENSMAMMAAIFRLSFPLPATKGGLDLVPGPMSVLPKRAPNLPAKSYPQTKS